MGSQIITLTALEAEYQQQPDKFRDRAVELLFPSALYGTALAARGARPFTKPQRWACIAGLRVAGLLNMRTEVNVAFLLAERVGCKDPGEASRLIEAASRARAAGPDDAFRLAKDIVRQRIASDPDERRRVMQELFGVIDANAPGSILTASETPGGSQPFRQRNATHGHGRCLPERMATGATARENNSGRVCNRI